MGNTSKDEVFYYSSGFLPFAIPWCVFHVQTPHSQRIFQVDWLFPSISGGVCLECAACCADSLLELFLFTCTLFSKQLSLPAHASGLPISSPENWTPSLVLEPAAWLCERARERALWSVDSFLSRPNSERQLQPASAWVGKWKKVLEKMKLVSLAV